MDILIVQLAIVFLPGLIWARLDVRYAMIEKPSQPELLIRAFMYGLTTYALLYILYYLFDKEFSILKIEGSGKNVFLSDRFIDEILWSLPVSLVLAVIWISANNKKWLTRFLQCIGATKNMEMKTFGTSHLARLEQRSNTFMCGISTRKSLMAAGWIRIRKRENFVNSCSEM